MSAARSIGISLCMIGLLLAGPAVAQQADPQQEGQEPEAEARRGEFEPSFGYDYSVGFFGGHISQGNPIATVQNLFFNTTFATGSDSAWGVRAVYRLRWRLAAEVEYGRASPGIDAVLTNPSGEERTELFFSELDVSYLAGSLRFELADTFIDPFLSVGLAGVTFTGEDDQGSTNLGLLFGGGIEVPIYEGLFGRFDVRGLRAHVEAAGLPPELGEGQDAMATQVLWTLGFGYRF